MKKKYVKPDLLKESMALQTKAVRTCSDAEAYWGGPMPLGGELIFTESMADCTKTPQQFMEEEGYEDGYCLFSTTDDGVVFNS